jgi:hypothetical protein
MRSRGFADPRRWAWKMVGPRGRLRQRHSGERQVVDRVAREIAIIASIMYLILCKLATTT